MCILCVLCKNMIDPNKDYNNNNNNNITFFTLVIYRSSKSICESKMIK